MSKQLPYSNSTHQSDHKACVTQYLCDRYHWGPCIISNWSWPLLTLSSKHNGQIPRSILTMLPKVGLAALHSVVSTAGKRKHCFWRLTWPWPVILAFTPAAEVRFAVKHVRWLAGDLSYVFGVRIPALRKSGEIKCGFTAKLAISQSTASFIIFR